MAPDFRFSIEKLESAKDWTRWKMSITLLLKTHDLLGHVTGDKTVPVLADHTDAAAFQKAKNTFEVDDAKALLFISQALNDANFDYIKTCTSAKDAYDKLIAIYDKSSTHRLDRLWTEFFHLQWKQGENIASLISRCQNIFTEANDELQRILKCAVPEAMLLFRIISTLPQDYLAFKTVWDGIPLKDRSIELLTERLCAFEQQIDQQQRESTALQVQPRRQTPLQTKENGMYGKNPKGNKPKMKKWSGFKKNPNMNPAHITCYGCGVSGHKIVDCPQNKKGFPSSSGIAMPCSVSQDDKNWIADSGASQHMTYDNSVFETFKKFAVPEVVNAAGGEKLVAYGCGKVNVQTFVAGKWQRNHLTDVWYVPDLRYQLFSVSHALGKGLSVTFENKLCYVRSGCQTIAVGRQSENGLFFINMFAENPRVPATVLISSSNDTLQVMHERLVHQNKKHCMRFLKNQGISLSNVNSEFCVGCAYGKAHRKSFHSRSDRPTKPAEQINVDVAGPMEEDSVGGSRFMLVLKDDFTKFRRVFFMKAKNEVAKNIEIFLNEARTAGHTVKEVVCDSGKEFINQEVDKILQDRGIHRRPAMIETPEQNGAAEREIRIIVEAARAMVHQKELPKKLWAEACNTAVYVLNHTGPTPVEDKTPYELWYGKSENFNIKRLKVFGTKCYVHEPKQRRQKWDKKSVEGLFVGYEAHDGYRIFIPSKNKIERSCNVMFLDESTYQPSTIEVTSSSNVVPDSSSENKTESSDSDGGQDEHDTNGRRYPGREHKRPQFLSENYVLFTSCLTGIETPTSYHEAITSPEAELWMQAMMEELKSHRENETWQLTQLPDGQHLLDNKWIYKIKTDTDGSPYKVKARLVARGFSQKAGYDYDDLFAPVARFDTLRTVLSVAASQNLHLHQFDVKTAFLYGFLDREIYMKQPEGFDDGSGRVCKLVRSLYGLKQAPRCWNRRFVQVIAKLQFQQSHADPCLFIKRSGSSILIIALYVDDGLVAGSNVTEIENLIFDLKQEFKITDGPLGSFLGVQIQLKVNGDIFISQSVYTEKILQRFGLENSKAFPTPCDVAKSQEGDTSTADVPYREAVGCLQYLAVATRPDIAFAVALVSRFLCKPTTDAWKSVKRIYRYLRGTSNVGLLYKSSMQTEFSVFSDADHAGDEKTRRSTSGMVSINAGAAITWWSRLQHTVAISSTEAEYIAASEAANELVWLKLLFKELLGYDGTPTLFVDNQSAIKLAQNPQHHKRSKHIDVRYHSIREKFESGTLKLEYVPSADQIADIMTKPLARTQFKTLYIMLGMNILCG